MPRFDGRYTDPEGLGINFSPDGTLRWSGESGTWQVHGGTLYVGTSARDCEGAIDASAIYLLCADREHLDSRTQLVLTFVASV